MADHIVPVALQARKPRNLAQVLVEAISADIRAGTLEPGDRLPTESAYMARHSVSRTVVREAISHLQAARLVQTRHGIGTFVLDPPPQGNLGIATVTTLRDVLAVLELRIGLESEAAGLAATRRSPEQLEQLRVALEEMHKYSGERTAESVKADVNFHQVIAQSTGNRYYVDILLDLGNAIIPSSRVNLAVLAHIDPAALVERVGREHEDIFLAIERRDPEGARAAMRIHLSNSRERLRHAQETVEASLQPS
jgi:GntR family transcriptional repressor for pyruvate dehydrogenase complex